MLNNKKLSVDLHSHLFIKKGLGWLFQGDFDEPLKAKGWKNRFLSKANAESLNQSGIGLIVVSLYAHPLLVKSVKESIRQQIEQANQFVAKNSEWVLAKNPLDAELAYKNGKKIMILSLEGAEGVIDTEKDIQEFVGRLGVSIVTLIHLHDDCFGGSAFVGKQTLLFNTFPYLKSLLFPTYNNGIRVNPKGLTEAGKELISLLIKYHVWIDLSHSSQETAKDIWLILNQTKQPYLISHTLPQKLIPTNRISMLKHGGFTPMSSLGF